MLQTLLRLVLLRRRKEATGTSAANAKAKAEAGLVAGGNVGEQEWIWQVEDLEEGKGRFGWGALKDLVFPC